MEMDVVDIQTPQILISQPADFLFLLRLPTFVDKTLFIQNLFDSGYHYWFITAPPGYGKSTILDMFSRYVAIDVDPDTGVIKTWDSEKYKIFSKADLLINQDSQFFARHFANFPVIILSFKDVYGETMELVLECFSEKLKQSFLQHAYLQFSHEITMANREKLAYYCSNSKKSRNILRYGVTFLAEMLEQHYKSKKVIVLIDDCDYPFKEFAIHMLQYHNDSDFLTIYDLLFFKDVLDDITRPDGSILYGLFLGTTSLMPYEPNNATIQNCMFPHNPYKQFFGLQKEEVAILLMRFCDHANIAAELENVIHHYGSELGPSTQDENMVICTSAFMQYLLTQNFKDFNDLPVISSIIKNRLRFSTIRHVFEYLLMFQWYDISDLNQFHMCHEPNFNIYIDHNPATPLFLFLRHLGFFEFKYEDNFNIIRINNICMGQRVGAALVDYYGEPLDKKLENCAQILNNISIDSSFVFYFGFMEEFRNTTMMYSNRFPSETCVSIQCMKDILSKTLLGFVLPIKGDTVTSDIKILLMRPFTMIGTEIIAGRVLIYFYVKFGIPVSQVLTEAFNDMSIKYPDRSEITISIGISTNDNFKYSIGWVVGYDLSNADFLCFQLPA